MTKFHRLLSHHIANPLKQSDLLAKALKLLMHRLEVIQSEKTVEDAWRTASRTRREVEMMFEEPKH